MSSDDESNNLLFQIQNLILRINHNTMALEQFEKYLGPEYLYLFLGVRVVYGLC
jgi:hypothetical protein